MNLKNFFRVIWIAFFIISSGQSLERSESYLLADTWRTYDSTWFHYQTEEEKQKILTRAILLVEAAKLGDLDSIKYLISLGADVNEKSNNGVTALMFARHYRHDKVVQYLQSQGAREY